MAPSPAASERAALCDLFAEVGPDAPTLCEGWTTADLAAHLVVRERRLVAAAGILVAPLARVTAKAMEEEKRRGFEQVVARVRGGPPPGPFRLPGVRDLNVAEYFIHHEDVRRPNGRGPRDDVALHEALWQALRRTARLWARRLQGAGLVLARDGTGEQIVAKAGGPTAVVTGTPGELTLFLSGRRSAARVALTGPEEAVAAVGAARLGL